MEVVDRVELYHVHDVHADGLADAYPYGVVLVVERDRVGRVKVVLAVKVGVEPVEDHDHLVGRRPAARGVDDVHAVQAVRYVLLERHYMAVVRVDADRLGAPLVREPPAGPHGLEDAVESGLVYAVKVHRVRL